MVVIGRLLGSHTVCGPFVVSFGHKSINVLDELVDALAVVCCELLHIVMTGTVDVVGRVLMPGLFVQLLCVVEWHDFISFPVDDIDRAVYVRHAVDVRELVKGQCPAKVEDNS